MSRFFFDVRDNGVLIPDDEGGEFVSREKGRQEALGALATLVKDKMPHADHRAFSVDMGDEDKRVVYTATVVLTAHWTE